MNMGSMELVAPYAPRFRLARGPIPGGGSYQTRTIVALSFRGNKLLCSRPASRRRCCCWLFARCNAQQRTGAVLWAEQRATSPIVLRFFYWVEREWIFMTSSPLSDVIQKIDLSRRPGGWREQRGRCTLVRTYCTSNCTMYLVYQVQVQYQ